MLEKTLESPLDCKEIQPVHPKWDQSWVFIVRTDVEAKTPILWPPDVKSWLRKRPWCWERLKVGGDGDDRGWDGWMASLTPWTWIWTGSGSWYGQGSLACCSPWGCKELDMTEQDWTVTVTYDVEHLFLCFCESPLVKYLLRSLAHFLIKLFVFLLSSFKIFLYPLDNSPLSDISFANIFSLLVKF